MADMASFREKLFEISFYSEPYFGPITHIKGKVTGKLKCKYSIISENDGLNLISRGFGCCGFHNVRAMHR